MSEKQKKVVIGIPVLLVGGSEIQTLTLVKALISGGYRVTILCYYEFNQEVVSEFEDVGSEVLLLNYSRPKNIWQTFEFVLRITKVFRRFNDCIVHIQYLAPGLLPVLAARIAGVRTVVSTVHIAGSYAYGTKNKFLLRVAAYFCDAFVCVSKDVEAFWFGNAEVFDENNHNMTRKHFTIYNAVDTDFIMQCRVRADKKKITAQLGIEGEKVIGIVGRLAVQKGHTVLLNAMKDVINTFPDVVLVVIGDGSERAKLEVQAKSLGLDPFIRWVGSKSQEDVFRYMSIFDIFVMPSLFEGFGLTAAEAMASGLPVVGTSVHGLAEVIEDGKSGLLVPPGDSSALAGAMLDLLNSPNKSLQFADMGKKRVCKLFSLPRFTDQMLTVYRYVQLLRK